MSLALGVNHSLHESAVSLVDEMGRVLFAQAEERISREKFDSRFPTRILRAGLDYVGASLEDVSAIGFSFPPAERVLRWQFEALLRGKMRFSRHNIWSPIVGYVSSRGDGYFGAEGSIVPVQSFGHHLSHGLSAAATSGSADAAVLVVDGKGARSATSIWHFRDQKMQRLLRVDFPNSLGVFYAKITQFLGFEPFSDEWKVMGLAAFGAPGVDLSEVIAVENGAYRVAGKALLGKNPYDLSALEVIIGQRRQPEEELSQRHRDIAFAAQDACERAMLELAVTAKRLTGSRTICVVGGVGMNCKANGRILTDGPFETVFVPPAASDEGASLGAAFAAGASQGFHLGSERLQDARLGIAWTDDEVEEVLKTCGLRYRRVDDPQEDAAQALAEGRVIARFWGRGEFGARALGARSILGHPGNISTRDRVNEAVKYRESWRPFAPMVLEERGSEYFEAFCPSPFMALTFRATKLAVEQAPAVVHEDGTARVQSVNRDSDPDLHRLLSAFHARTGVPILLNTSFNLKGEPIVFSPRDAVRTFFSSGLDALYINAFVVTK